MTQYAAYSGTSHKGTNRRAASVGPKLNMLHGTAGVRTSAALNALNALIWLLLSRVKIPGRTVRSVLKENLNHG